METLSVLLMLGCFWLFYRALVAAYQTLLNFYSWVPPVTKELPLEDTPLPTVLNNNANLLVSLGFQPSGMTHTKYFMQGTVNTWYYIHKTGEIFAELIMYRSAVMFNTWFSDDAYLTTSYPVGNNIETANFQAHFANKSAETAYQDHRETLDVWRSIHGQAVKFATVSDILAYEPLYRRRYRIRHMWRVTLTTLGFTLIWFAMGVGTGWSGLLDLTGYSTEIFLRACIITAVVVIAGFIGMNFLQKTLISPPGAIDS
jgi:hypothetical protein